MDRDLVQLLRPRRPGRRSEAPSDLVTCSLCLRVRRKSEWVEAEHVIRDLRSYELATPPRLRSAVCDVCADTIFGRRAQGLAA
jgi:hypothetical protein